MVGPGVAGSASRPVVRRVGDKYIRQEEAPAEGAMGRLVSTKMWGNRGQRAKRKALGTLENNTQETFNANIKSKSDFPSLSSNAPHQANNSQSTWAMPNVRPLGQPSRRSEGILGGQQSQARQQVQQQQDELFSSSSQLPSSQASFRYGGQNPVGRGSPPQEGGDDFPALRNGGGDIGQDRNVRLQQAANGLLNAVNEGSRAAPPASQNSRDSTAQGRSPSSRPEQVPTAAPGVDKEAIGFGRPPQSELSDNMRAQAGDSSAFTDASKTNPSANQGASISTEQAQASKPEHEGANGIANEEGPIVEDPLPGMSDRDRYGLKGLFGLLNGPYPDQAMLMSGIDINTLGFDLSSTERLSTQIWSPFDDLPSRPAVQPHTIPDCYAVHNVQPVQEKMSSFSDETLMFMFYNNPQDVQQMIAADELRNRNWRYHKKLQCWLTKDELMQPVLVGNGVERGYYIVFDPKLWSRERREMMLNYLDLETVPAAGPPMA